MKANPQRILILFAHPALEKSRVNVVLAQRVRDLDGATFHDLYEAYPDAAIDVAHEHALLEAHGTVVLQHPLYWYSVPPLLKEWFDVVLTWGWAYGPGGRALHGKRMVSAVTTGGGADAYRRDGLHGHTMREFLLPIERSARLCGMSTEPCCVFRMTDSRSFRSPN